LSLSAINALDIDACITTLFGAAEEMTLAVWSGANAALEVLNPGYFNDGRSSMKGKAVLYF
jgi:hypothetical protein